jgi:hypothetical protein
MKKDCRDFKSARAKARKGREPKDQETAKLAAGPSPRAVEIESDVSAYIAFNQSDSTDSTEWILDSGAFRYMCGDIASFSNFKKVRRASASKASQ